ncbi:MAG TPA: enoyl-CoA hydratase/isomerase family protein [Gemmatimonadaceae bacterium]|nr:enoyl-CoA hydratase/isomerase family protein [Gemmatimonadaceae bacterium]
MTTTAADSGFAELLVEDGIGTIRFHHPKGNSLPAALLRRLAECVTRAAADAAVRVIVLRSEGDGPFCAGASFDELKAIKDERQGKEFFMGFARLILAMTRAPQLIIARVHGRVVGGGVGVVAAADYAVATHDASVRLSELAVGIGPFVVGPVIERKIGVAHFAALAVDAGGWRDATWAERVGLFARLAAPIEELDASVSALAATLARSNPQAMARMKAVFWAGTDDWDALLERRAEISGALVLSDFTRQAIAAFARR